MAGRLWLIALVLAAVCRATAAAQTNSPEELQQLRAESL
jgi:hypothetical protein